MAEELIIGSADSIYNGPVETGFRAIMLLDAAYPESFDLVWLTWLDHFVVHTSQLGGPDSLHPDLPQSSGELVVRRRLVEAGLSLLRRVHLVDVTAESDGIRYLANENASAFIDSMRSAYASALRERSDWLVQEVKRLGQAEFAQVVSKTVGKWAIEFQADTERHRR
jgi:hypothetical protein